MKIIRLGNSRNFFIVGYIVGGIDRTQNRFLEHARTIFPRLKEKDITLVHLEGEFSGQIAIRFLIPVGHAISDCYEVRERIDYTNSIF